MNTTQKTPIWQQQLEANVADYYELEAMIKELTVSRDVLNKSIKETMALHSIKNVTVGDVSANFIVQNRTSLDEPKAIQRLKDLNLPQAIKLVETVNQEAVEKLIYEGQLAPKSLEDCVLTKKVEVLKVSNKKKGRDQSA